MRYLNRSRITKNGSSFDSLEFSGFETVDSLNDRDNIEQASRTTPFICIVKNVGSYTYKGADTTDTSWRNTNNWVDNRSVWNAGHAGVDSGGATLGEAGYLDTVYSASAASIGYDNRIGKSPGDYLGYAALVIGIGNKAPTFTYGVMIGAYNVCDLENEMASYNLVMGFNHRIKQLNAGLRSDTNYVGGAYVEVSGNNNFITSILLSVINPTNPSRRIVVKGQNNFVQLSAQESDPLNYGSIEGLGNFACGDGHQVIDVSILKDQTSFNALLAGVRNIIIDGVKRSAVIGGQGISVIKNDYVYVPNLNINTDLAFDDDTTAGLAGLEKGDIFQTTGNGQAPLNVAGILMRKQ